MHALGVEYSVVCITSAETLYFVNNIVKFFILISLRVLNTHSLGCIFGRLGSKVLPVVVVMRSWLVVGVAVILIVARAVSVVTILSKTSGILGVFSKPLFHHFVVEAEVIFEGVACCAVVELTVSEVSACGFPGVIEVRCFLDGTFGVHHVQPIV